MDLALAGKRVLITGASRGIGRAIAETLAEEGCQLRLVARDKAGLDAAAADLRGAHGVPVEVMAADLAKPDAAAQTAAWAGPVDILVNNAGSIPPGDLFAINDEAWRAAWDLKVFGFISMCRIVYPTMAAQGGGVIVNVIGAAGERPSANYICGGTGNAALIAFTKALGAVSHRDGVRVVGVNPGMTLTERAEALARAQAEARFGDAELWRQIHAEAPFGRPAAPLEIASAVAFLASERSAYTSGVTLTINGGG